MTTETRTGSDWKLRPSSCEPSVDGRAATRRSQSQRRSYDHWNQQLPYPANPPLRDPQPGQKSECHQRGRSREEAEDKQDPEAYFKNRLHRTGYRSVRGSNRHHLLPNRWRVPVLDVRTDQFRIFLGAVQPLALVLEECRNE